MEKSQNIDIDDFKNDSERHDFLKFLASQLQTENGDSISYETIAKDFKNFNKNQILMHLLTKTFLDGSPIDIPHFTNTGELRPLLTFDDESESWKQSKPTLILPEKDSDGTIKPGMFIFQKNNYRNNLKIIFFSDKCL